jgi:hypothetical protein
MPAARIRNGAICPRVTGLPGQYLRGDVEQPLVIPRATRASIQG